MGVRVPDVRVGSGFGRPPKKSGDNFQEILRMIDKVKKFRKFVSTTNMWKLQRWSAGIKLFLSYSFVSPNFLCVAWMPSHSSTRRHSSDRRRVGVNIWNDQMYDRTVDISEFRNFEYKNNESRINWFFYFWIYFLF